MNKIIIVVLLISSLYYPQIKWYWQNPYPTLNELDNIFFKDTLTGWISSRNEFYKTTDGGTGWMSQEIGPDSLIQIEFVSENIGYMIGKKKLLKTVDGGLSWSVIYSSYWNNVCFKFIDESTGYLAGERFVLKTTNGGATWKTALAEISFVISSIWANENNITVVGNHNTIKKSTTGGMTWVNQTSTYACHWKKVIYINESTGFIGGELSDEQGEVGSIQKTTDGGLTWNIVLLGNMNHLYFSDSLNGYAYYKPDGYYNSKKTFIKTTDGGENWEIWLNGSIYNFINKLTFLNNNLVYSIGSDGEIKKTTDAGSNWINLITRINVSALNRINFYNLDFGIACGNKGILKTTNGGANWKKVLDGPLFDIHFIDDKGAVAVGHFNIVKTTDGGESWIKYDSVEHFWESVSFSDANNGIAVEDRRPNIIRTTNGGIDWNIQTFDNNRPLTAVHMIDSTRIILVGSYSYGSLIMLSTDGGVTWMDKYKNPAITERIYDIDFIDDKIGVAVGRGERGYVPAYTEHFITVYLTTDGGDSWTRKEILDDYKPDARVSYIDINNIFILGADSLVISNDKGVTWRKEGITHSIYDVHFINSRRGYLAGGWEYTSLIMSSFDVQNPTTIMEENFHSTISNYMLEQNYPNPFNPTTKINYTIAKDGRASLIIYDVLGREVMKLFDEEKFKGEYTAEFNAAELSSGIYFYRLQVDGFTETKKMVLMK